MKTLKALAIATVVSSAFSINAQAAVVNFGTVTTGPLAADLIAAPASGAFTDLYKFVLTGVSSVDYTVTVINESIAYPVFGPTGLTFSNVALSKFQDGAAGFSYGLYDATNTKILNPTSLAAGAYTIKVSGVATGLYGGKYSLNANVVSAVPEPETNLMMLLGLTAIGTMVYRKKNA